MKWTPVHVSNLVKAGQESPWIVPVRSGSRLGSATDFEVRYGRRSIKASSHAMAHVR